MKMCCNPIYSTKCQNSNQNQLIYVIQQKNLIVLIWDFEFGNNFTIQIGTWILV